MSDPSGANWQLGGPRHAPKAEVSAPELQQRGPVASFSNPAGETQGWSSTGAITNRAGQRNRKSPRAAGPVSSQSGVESPLNLDNLDSIVEESGLGKQPEDMTPGERMSDADEPTQGIHTDEHGNMVHLRQGPSGVTRTPLGARATTSYGATAAPDYFSGG